MSVTMTSHLPPHAPAPGLPAAPVPAPVSAPANVPLSAPQAPGDDDGWTLEAQRAAFAQRRFLAMPLAGTLAWGVIGLAGALLSPQAASLVLFAATGSIVWLGLALSRWTGEHLAGPRRDPRRNEFDALFMHGVAMALLVWAIAIPFAVAQPASLPLGVGILTGLMWLPLSWILRHPVGLAHGIGRTVAVTAAWHLAPAHRMTLIPAVIVLGYLLTILVLERRWRALQAASTTV